MDNEKKIKNSTDYATISRIQTIIDQIMNCIYKIKVNR